jgi:hypothetical protein
MLTYGQALRAIGQDLEGHGALVYDISIKQSEYRVQCDCDLPPPGNLLSLCYTSRILEQIDFIGKLNVPAFFLLSARNRPLALSEAWEGM